MAYEKIEEKGKIIWMPLSTDAKEQSGNAIPVHKQQRTAKTKERFLEPRRYGKRFLERKTWY